MNFHNTIWFIYIFWNNFSLGFSTNKVKIQFNRAPVSGLYGPYTACFDYKSEYPKNIDASKPFHRLEDKEKLFVKGEARLQYGPTTECDMGDGEVKWVFFLIFPCFFTHSKSFRIYIFQINIPTWNN